MVSERKRLTNRLNWSRRRGLTPAGRERLRAAALRHRPWDRSTGPRSAEGKDRARRNAVGSGVHCKTVHPHTAMRTLLLALRTYGRAVAERIRNSDDPIDGPLNIPADVGELLAEAFAGFCADYGVTFTEDDIARHKIPGTAYKLIEQVFPLPGGARPILGFIETLIAYDWDIKRARWARLRRDAAKRVV